MTAKTGAQRVKETEARKRAAGLKRMTLWAGPEVIEARKLLGDEAVLRAIVRAAAMKTRKEPK